MANDRGLVDWEHQPLHDATIEDLDLEKVKAYLARRSENSRQTSRFKDRERVLLGMECVVKTSDNEVVPTNAGMLFFGSHPQEHIIQSDVACVLFRETVGASRYADRRIITGTLQELIDGAELFLSRYIAVGAKVEGFKRIDIPEYSLEVLREAVVQHEILPQNQSDQRERRLTQAVEYVQKYGFITNSIYRQLTGVSDRTAHRDLETLIERGRLKGTGQKAARRYVLA
jgi:predicted HTH transcriptional regulator